MKVPINSIKPNPSNPRVLKDWQYQKLKKSITEFPKMLELRPIVVDDDGIILGGNMRYRILQELKYKEVEIVRASELTEEEKKRFIIADNVSFGEWDNEILANEWDVELLSDWGLDLEFDFTTNNENYEGLDANSKLDKFMNADIKRLVLAFAEDEFEVVVNWLGRNVENLGLKNHSEFIYSLTQNQ